MRQFTSQEFRQDASGILEAALKEPVAITYNGQPRLIILDAAEYARLKSRDRQVIDAHEMPHDLAMSLLEPISDPDQIELNRLLE